MLALGPSVRLNCILAAPPLWCTCSLHSCTVVLREGLSKKPLIAQLHSLHSLHSFQANQTHSCTVALLHSCKACQAKHLLPPELHSCGARRAEQEASHCTVAQFAQLTQLAKQSKQTHTCTACTVAQLHRLQSKASPSCIRQSKTSVPMSPPRESSIMCIMLPMWKKFHLSHNCLLHRSR